VPKSISFWNYVKELLVLPGPIENNNQLSPPRPGTIMALLMQRNMNEL
jgi:hypothetical protein